MKLTFKADDLASAVTWTARYANPRSNTPILSGLLFQPIIGAEQDSGYIWAVTGFDYDHCATAAVEPVEPGLVLPGQPERFVLHGRWLASLVGKLRGEVTIVVDDGVATITSGRGRWTLPCMDPASYPELPEDPPAIGSVPAADLRAALEKVAYAAASNEEALPVLTMACVTAMDGHLEMFTTDRYRVSRAYLSWLHKDQDPFFLNPDTAALMLRDATGEAALLYDPDTQSVGIACGDRVLVSRGIDGTSAPVAKFFDVPLTVFVTARRDGLLDALEQATVGAAPSTPLVLDFDPGDRRLTLEAKDKVLSTAGSVEIDAYATEAGWSALKAEYLRDAVKMLDSEYVTLGFVGAEGVQKPLQLTCSSDDEPTEWVPDTTHQQLIMPIRFDR